MNLGACRIVLRSRGIAELMDLACLVTTTGAPKQMAGMSAIALLPGFVLCLALRHELGWSWALIWVLAWLYASFAQGLFTMLVGRWMFASELTVSEVLGAFKRQLGSYLSAWIVRWLYALVGAIVVVGPYRGLLVHETCLLERAGGAKALRRSVQMVSALGARAFGFMIVLFVSQLAIVGVAELLGQGIVGSLLQLGSPFDTFSDNGGSPYALLGLLVSAPYVATARFLFYIDARTRKDGWDIQVRFMDIAGRATTEGAA